MFQVFQVRYEPSIRAKKTTLKFNSLINTSVKQPNYSKGYSQSKTKEKQLNAIISVQWESYNYHLFWKILPFDNG